jgi:hypothetical protein
MTKFIINPGSGPCKNTTEQFAIDNMKQFIIDLQNKQSIIFWRISEHDYNNEYDDGRYAFILKIRSVEYEIQMPGLPLNKVRYMQEADQNIWDYPRLYINGSSWVWFFALDIIKHKEVK